MVKIDLILDKKGCFKRLSASGHAGAGKPGRDPVCAAVSVLVDTAYRVLSERPGLVLEHDAGKRGRAELLLADPGAGNGDFIAAVSAFVEKGFSALAEDFPANCSLTVTNDETEE